MAFFDYSKQVAQARAQTASPEALLSARTDIGKAEFPMSVKASGLILVTPQTANLIDDRGRWAVVIGVATWSDPDLKFLDQFVQKRPDNMDAFVFDIDAIQSEEDFYRLLPGVKMTIYTPMVVELKANKEPKMHYGLKASTLWLSSIWGG